MARFRGMPLVVASALAFAAPAVAQVGGSPWEFSGGVGVAHFDARARMHDAPTFGIAAGLRLQPWLSLEVNGLVSPSKADSSVGLYTYTAKGSSIKYGNHNFSLESFDARFNLRPAQNRLVPYALAGIGAAGSHGGGVAPEKLNRGAVSIGLGLLWNVHDQRTYLRFQLREVMGKDRNPDEFLTHAIATVGVQYVFKGKILDQDRDGVRDWLDKCPDTPIGCKVDANGCPIDSDGDGVCDGVDQCPNTPPGCKVDDKGCPLDADGDGVCDTFDKCPDTPKGAVVDKNGCPIDSDGDGVPDGLDKCPNTPKGCPVDANGCSKDSDGDGVCDGLDLCPNTPAGLKVDEHGCPIEVSEKEIQLLDTGTIRLQNIEFDTGKATLKAGSDSLLDQVGHILVQYPTLRIEIGGHTDNKGKPDLNLKLSQARADTVMNFLRRRYTLPDTMLSARGYGQTRPIAPNLSEIGRSKNRRVEFKVLNTEALKIEREHRRYLFKNEGVPSDTSKAKPSAPAMPSPPVTPPPAIELPPPATPTPADTAKKPAPKPAPADTTKKK